MQLRRALLAITVALISLLSLSSESVLAQNQLSPSALGITVSPVVDELSLKSGETVTRLIKVTNPVQEVVTLYPMVLDFTTDNEDGRPTFFSNKERSSRYSLSNWVSFKKEFIRVAPGEFEQVEAVISAPTNAEPGGHFGSVLFSTEPPKLEQDQSQVAVVGLIGSLILVTVPGEIRSKLIIDDFEAPNILTKAPANFSLRFANTGNVHAKPVGELKIRNMFGDMVTALNINEAGGNVLPDSKRRFNLKWDFDWKTIGRFTATAAVSYGSGDQEAVIQDTRTFYVLPTWFLITIAVLLLLIVILIIWRKRRKNRRQTFQSPPPPATPPNAPPPAPKKFVMR